GFVKDQPTGAAAADADVIRGAGCKRIALELRGVEYPNLARAEGSDIQGLAVGRDCHAQGGGETVVLHRSTFASRAVCVNVANHPGVHSTETVLGGRCRPNAVVDVLVEVAW